MTRPTHYGVMYRYNGLFKRWRWIVLPEYLPDRNGTDPTRIIAVGRSFTEKRAKADARRAATLAHLAADVDHPQAYQVLFKRIR